MPQEWFDSYDPMICISRPSGLMSASATLFFQHDNYFDIVVNLDLVFHDAESFERITTAYRKASAGAELFTFLRRTLYRKVLDQVVLNLRDAAHDYDGRYGAEQPGTPALVDEIQTVIDIMSSSFRETTTRYIREITKLDIYRWFDIPVDTDTRGLSLAKGEQIWNDLAKVDHNPYWAPDSIAIPGTGSIAIGTEADLSNAEAMLHAYMISLAAWYDSLHISGIAYKVILEVFTAISTPRATFGLLENVARGFSTAAVK